MYQNWTKAKVREMLKWRTTGLTWRAVAKKIGRSEAAVVGQVGIMKKSVEGRVALARVEARRARQLDTVPKCRK
jgi:hypothetical protein